MKQEIQSTFRLDERLSVVAGLFKPGGTGADIGADHGRLSCYLLLTGRCKHMLVSDISPLALEKAKTLLKKHDLSEQASFIVSDGFEAINQRVDTVAVCGMGGKTIADMILKKPEICGSPDLILSAHTDLFLLRTTLSQNDYQIAREFIVLSGGRYYNVLHAYKGHDPLSERQRFIGVHVQQAGSASLHAYYQWRLAVENCNRRQESRYIDWLKEELSSCCVQR